MILRITAMTAGLLLLTGCTNMELSLDSIGVDTLEYGECIVASDKMPSFDRKKVRFVCQHDRVLLGDSYKVDGKEVIDSAILQQKDDKYFITDKSRATVVRGLHSICQLRPLPGDGNNSLRRYYFDMELKECRPFIWSGKDGLVPFNTEDACEQYCEH